MTRILLRWLLLYMAAFEETFFRGGVRWSTVEMLAESGDPNAQVAVDRARIVREADLMENVDA